MPRGETVIVASAFDQARIGFGHVLAFLRERHGADLEDRSLWRVWDSPAIRRQSRTATTAQSVKAIGSDPRRAHGLAPVLVLADEPSQWEPAKAEAMVAALANVTWKAAGQSSNRTRNPAGRYRSLVRQDAGRRRGLRADTRGP